MATHDGIDFSGMFQVVFSAGNCIRQPVEYLVNPGMQQEGTEPLQAATTSAAPVARAITTASSRGA